LHSWGGLLALVGVLEQQGCEQPPASHGIFDCRVLRSCLVPQCSYPPFYPTSNDVLRIVTGCLRPTPADNLPILPKVHRLRTHILHHHVPRISTIFILPRLNPLGQRKHPIVISLSRMLCFGRVCASPCALNVSAALQGAYTSSHCDCKSWSIYHGLCHNDAGNCSEHCRKFSGYCNYSKIQGTPLLFSSWICFSLCLLLLFCNVY